MVYRRYNNIRFNNDSRYNICRWIYDICDKIYNVDEKKQNKVMSRYIFHYTITLLDYILINYENPLNNIIALHLAVACFYKVIASLVKNKSSVNVFILEHMLPSDYDKHLFTKLLFYVHNKLENIKFIYIVDYFPCEYGNIYINANNNDQKCLKLALELVDIYICSRATSTYPSKLISDAAKCVAYDLIHNHKHLYQQNDDFSECYKQMLILAQNIFHN